MQFITIEQLRNKLGGRSRNRIFADIDLGLLPRPIKLSASPAARNYWVEEDVDAAMRRLAEQARGSTDAA